ncbi:METAP2 isoform 10, partial [Pan troglodytes]
MAGVEEVAASGSHLNGDLDPDDREEGAASTAEEAAKKKRRKKKKSKGPSAAGEQEPDKESGASVDEVARQLERSALEDKERDEDDEGYKISLPSPRLTCCGSISAHCSLDFPGSDGDGDGDGATGKKKKKKKKKRGPKVQTDPPSVPICDLYPNGVFPKGQ